MSALFDLLVPELHRRFHDRGLVMVEAEHPHLRFPAVHPEVGDIEIYDYDGDELTVCYGTFTHCHYGNHCATTPQAAKEAVDEVIAALDALFSDRLIMWGHDGNGGIELEGDHGSAPCDPEVPQYVWSGPVKRCS